MTVYRKRLYITNDMIKRSKITVFMKLVIAATNVLALVMANRRNNSVSILSEAGGVAVGPGEARVAVVLGCDAGVAVVQVSVCFHSNWNSDRRAWRCSEVPSDTKPFRSLTRKSSASCCLVSNSIRTRNELTASATVVTDNSDGVSV